MREEEILFWIDELHVMESELKKVFIIFTNQDNSYQIKWLCEVKNHERFCVNPKCQSHLKLNIANL